MPQPCKSILIIEDDPDIRFLLSCALETSGYVVFQAANGKEGLEILNKGDIHPCLILLDLMMPVMSGWDFLRELKRENQDIIATLPVYIVSASQGAASEARKHATGFIKKPVELEQLLQIVARHCHP